VGSRTAEVGAAISPPAGLRDSLAIERPRIVVLGDSLTAGLGLSPEEAFPSRLQERLDAEGLAFDIVNAGVSGDTTAGGLRRLAWALDEKVRVVIVALGGNDGLRGLPIDQMKGNLEAIIEQAASHGAKVLLAGMEAPPNFGAYYTRAFRGVFREIADERDEIVFVPFLLEGVAGQPHLNQADGIHPNAAGAAKIADHVWPALRSMLTAAAR
jgi:acyl-CoA thioesterase-1